jgi:hypothetical protein
MIDTATDRLELMRQGADAFHAGLEPGDCPYALGGTGEESQKAAIWLRGYVYARIDAGESIM